MRIIVTGAAGFIGSHLSKKLFDLGHIILGIDNFNSYYDKKLKKDRVTNLIPYVEVAKLDITNTDKLNKLFKLFEPDSIINLAAQAGVRYSIENPFIYEKYNNLGFLNLLECAKNNNIKNIIYASSSSIYGDTQKVSKFKEDQKTDFPISIYAATKKYNELLAYTYSHLYKLNIIGLRFFTVYGPWGRPDMALFKFTKNIIAGKEIEVYNNGNLYRDFTYVDDIVDGIVLSLNKIYGYDILNLGFGKPRKLLDFIEILEKCLNKKAIISNKPLQKGDVFLTFADISKAKKLLKFKPKIDLEQGIEKFVSWYNEYYKI